jgi:hypothetical protein
LPDGGIGSKNSIFEHENINFEHETAISAIRAQHMAEATYYPEQPQPIPSWQREKPSKPSI